jgi:alpha-amylase
MSNGVMFQCFHWFSRSDGVLWNELAELAPELASRGITSVWIPPCGKAAGGSEDVGYAVYDPFDLGEFDQKGSVRTKYGTREELLRALTRLHEHNIQVYADMVFNHRCGADETEEVRALRVCADDRNQVEAEPIQIKAWTKFDFPGRGDTHSAFKWNFQHFTAVDCNADAPDEQCIYLLEGKTFSGEVSFEQGNFDFLMGCDVDTYHPDVREELYRFGRWFVDTTGVGGFRLDAAKHIPASFFRDWLNHMRSHFGDRELFSVAEYWSADLDELNSFLAKVEETTQLFDVPLHFRFVQASRTGRDFDLSTVFDGSLVSSKPSLAVTFVDNHDTQPGASLESWVEPWFKPLAYALILLRRDGYPCLFAADYYGHEGEPVQLPSHRVLLDVFMDARAKYNYGDQHDFLDHPSCVAWLRTGDEEHPGAMVVVMSNGDAGSKRIETGKIKARFFDCTGHDTEEIETDEEGAAEFRCPGGSLSVWLQR